MNSHQNYGEERDEGAAKIYRKRSGTSSSSGVSPDKAKAKRRQEEQSYCMASGAKVSENPMLDYVVTGAQLFSSKGSGTPGKLDGDWKTRAAALFRTDDGERRLTVDENRNHMNIKSGEPVESAYKRSKTEHTMKEIAKQRKNKLELKASNDAHDHAETRTGRASTDLKSTNVEDLPQRIHLGNQNILVNEHQSRQPIEARVLRSVPLRQPFGPNTNRTASPALSGHDAKSRSRSRTSTPAQNPNLQNAFQGKEFRNMFYPHTTSARDRASEPIAEQESAREISSINVKPQNQMTVTHDDSQYIFTSQQNSVAEEDEEKVSMIGGGQNAHAGAKHANHGHHDGQGRQAPHPGGGLSEPQILTRQQKAQSQEGSHDFRAQIQQLTRHGEKMATRRDPRAPQGYAAGSFGNAQDFQAKRVGDADHTNSFVQLERLLEAKSQDSDEKLNFNTNQQQQQQRNAYNIKDQASSNRYEKEVQSFRTKYQRMKNLEIGNVERDHDSSLEFQKRKYQIRPEVRRSGRQSRSRSAAPPVKRDQDYEDHAGKRTKQGANANSPRRRTLSGSSRKSQEARAYKTEMHARTKPRPGSRSGSRDQNTSHSSSSQKSEVSYDKHSNHSKKQRKRNGSQSESRAARKKKQKEDRRQNKSISRSKEHKKPKQAHKSRSKSITSGKQRKSYRVNSSHEANRSRNTRNKSKSTTRKSNRRGQNSSTQFATIQSHLRTPVCQSSNQWNTVRGGQLTGRPPVPGNAFATLSKENIPSAMSTITPQTKTPTNRTPKSTSNSLAKHPATTKESRETSKDETTLAQNLLLDLAKKYKNMEKITAYGTPGAGPSQSSAQRTQMISEIQSLASALIKSEKRIGKLKIEHKAQQKQLKMVMAEQEECIDLLQSKMHKLDMKYQKLHRNQRQTQLEKDKQEQRHRREASDGHQQLEELQQQLHDERAAFEHEKRDIIVNMEQDHQASIQKYAKKHELKMNSVQSVNDQLNVKLRETQTMQTDFEKIETEYQQSLRILNEQQDQIQQQQEEQEDLNGQISDLQLKLDHTEAQSAEEISELSHKLVQQQSRHDQKVLALKQAQHCELQKNKLSLGQVEDSQKFDYEVQINNQQLTLKQKEQQIDELSSVNEQLKAKFSAERDRYRGTEQELMRQNTALDEQKEKLEQQAGDLETRIQHLQRRLQLKELECEESKVHRGTIEQDHNSSMTQRSENEKDQIIHELKMKLREHVQIINKFSNSIKSQTEREEATKRDYQAKMMDYEDKVAQQQKEIHILAQGFQAQQAKLNKQMVKAQPSAESCIHVEDSNRQRAARTKNSRDIGPQSPFSGPGSNNDIIEVSSTAREHLLNHQNVMNIQSGSSLREFDDESVSDEDREESERNLYFRNNNYKQNRKRIIEAEKAASSVENTNSLSSTDRQLEQMSSERRTQAKIYQLKMSSHTFGNQKHATRQDNDHCDSAESPATSQYDDDVASSSNVVTEKDEEIKILWNVIAQLKQNTNQESNIGDAFRAIGTKKKSGHGGQSSIMNIDTAGQYLSPGEGAGHRPGRYPDEMDGDQDADGREQALQRTIQHAAQMSLATRGHQEDNQEYESTPVVKSKGLITFTGPRPAQPKELVDVKKRLSMLMSRPQGSSSSSPQQVTGAESVGRRTADLEQQNANRFGNNAQRIQPIK